MDPSGIPTQYKTLNELLTGAGISPEVVTLIIWYIAPKLASPIASWWKRKYNTTGPDTLTVVKFSSAALAIAIGFGTQAYEFSPRGIFNCVCAGILTYIRTTGDYDRDVQVRTKASEIIEARNSVTEEEPAIEIREISPEEWSHS